MGSPDPWCTPGCARIACSRRPTSSVSRGSVMSSTAAGWLEQLQEVTVADELIITRITHDYAGRIRSYRLLAEEWHRLGQL
jgi:hypothetical protein